MKQDDPRITTYALGEMTKEEQAAFEMELAAHPEIRAEIEAISLFGNDLSAELLQENCPELASEQRQAVMQNASAATNSEVLAKKSIFPYVASIGGLAACFVIALQMINNEAPEQAKNELVMAEKTQAAPIDEALTRPIEKTPTLTPPQEDVAKDDSSTDKKMVAPVKLERDALEIPKKAEESRSEVKESKSALDTVIKNKTEALERLKRELEKPTTGVNSQLAQQTQDKALITSASIVKKKPVSNPTINARNQQAQANLDKAMQFMSLKRYTEATQALDDVLVDDPFNADAARMKRRAEVKLQAAGIDRRTATRLDRMAEIEWKWSSRLRLADKAERKSTYPYPIAETAGKSKTTLKIGQKLHIPARTESNNNRHGQYVENKFLEAQDTPLSTFSVDVDSASYTFTRRLIQQGVLPNADGVRIEEMLNYFDYDYPAPKGENPFGVGLEVCDSPWSKGNKLVKIALKAKTIAADQRPQSNLVFLLDVSGSMSEENKLPLLKSSLQRMVDRLNEKDRISIVVYAGSAGVVLEPTLCTEEGKNQIIAALSRLSSGGSTNGAGGITQAYQLAKKNYIKGGANRVILATDGDFNVGVSSDQGLLELVKEKAKEDVFLTVLGFGQGNLNDAMMEEISNKGNGNYFYIDSVKEGFRVLCQKISGTLVTVAKDVKIQVEFNPALVHSYRLIGYDNRMLKKEDFNDDKKDAGEMGAGHTVTAIYEIVPVGSANAFAKVDKLKYQPEAKTVVDKVAEQTSDLKDELMTVKLRHKAPEGGASKLLVFPLKNQQNHFEEASRDMKFAAAVSAFGMLLKNSEYKGDSSLYKVLQWLEKANISESSEDRKEFFDLVKKVKALKEK